MDTKKDKKRIEELLAYLRLSRNALGIAIGESNGAKFNHIISGRNGISENLASKICDKYPEISYDWLLNGVGLMITKGETNENKEKNIISLGSDDSINVDVIVDAVLLNQEKFETNKRFLKYLESVKDKAIIEYQEKLLLAYQNKNKEIS